MTIDLTQLPVYCEEPTRARAPLYLAGDRPPGAARVFLIGEANPYGADPRYALHPLPEESAGGRLQRKIFAMPQRVYLRRFERRNLCPQRWSLPIARESAHAIQIQLRFWTEAYTKEAEPVVVLFGKKVHDAWRTARPLDDRTSWRGVPPPEWHPFTIRDRTVILPHPSGLSRGWRDPYTMPEARRLLISLVPDLAEWLGRVPAAGDPTVER